ncbi:MAG: DUF2188 domain-containing protein [Actinomycetota bacterium]|nr:DUF2188 domain-containing protein [Actinomycetota bacterium]
MANNVQVYADPEGGWSVKGTGEDETGTRRFDSKEEAVREGERLAREQGAELVVHDEEGMTEEKSSP